jgi:predicted SprT family Zn-dependent metalloprotease
METALRPTRTYTSLDAVYDHFNADLFEGKLPPCLITMQRRKGSYGYFAGGRFANTADIKDVTDEIALNPKHFAGRPAEDTISTLVREMVHLWQYHFGKPSRGGYHNREWGDAMEAIGLIPTATGRPGGKRTGQSMTHMIEPGGRFAVSCAAFLARWGAVLYQDRWRDDDGAGTRKKKAASKTKYACPVCGLNAWAKPDVRLTCTDCEEELEAEEA